MLMFGIEADMLANWGLCRVVSVEADWPGGILLIGVAVVLSWDLNTGDR